MPQTLAFIGTYTRDGSKGIYSYRYAPDTGTLSPLGGAECSNPSFLALHPNGQYLYAVCEIGELNGEKAGGVSAFAIDPSGAFLLAANQNANNIVTFRIDQETGELTPTGQETEVPRPVGVKFLEV